MTTFIRGYFAQPGRLQDIVSVLQDMVSVLKYIAAMAKRINGTEGRVAGPVGGNLAEAFLMWQSESLSSAEQGIAKIMRDPGFAELYGKLSASIVPGGATERLYRHV